MFYWDPKPEIFIIPILNIPVLWYSLFFALGFYLAIPIWSYLTLRLSLLKPSYLPDDIILTTSLQQFGNSPEQILRVLNHKIETSQVTAPERQYLKLIKSFSETESKRAINRLTLDQTFSSNVLSLKKKVSILADRLLIYMIVATVLGARIGHFVFYENPETYLTTPWVMFKIWNGKFIGFNGLASHGGCIGIFIAAFIFIKKFQKIAPYLTFITLLDLISIPAALIGSLIRLGNFFNQEILGTPTNLPWAVTFGHPTDYSASIPRHPSQLYESVCYFCLFVLMFQISKNIRFFEYRGFFAGLFLTGVFGFRFFVEFFKLEQSSLISEQSLFTMGQILSLPIASLGLLLLFFSSKFLKTKFS